MPVQLIGIPSDSPMLPLAYPFLEGFAGASNGKWTFAGLLQDISEQEKQVWAGIDGDDVIALALTEVVMTHTGKWCRLIAGGGEGRERWQHLVSDLIQVTRDEGGFAGFEAVVRPGWSRVYRDVMTETHRLMEVKF